MFEPQIWLSLVSLIIIEIILGIDNILFISIVCNNLDVKHRYKARTIGLSLALCFRIMLLLGFNFLINLDKSVLWEIYDNSFSVKDIILIAGGLFLIVKSIMEIHNKIEGTQKNKDYSKKSGLHSIIAQIVLLDIIFSFDSILTALGLSRDLYIIVIAMVIGMIFMLLSSKGLTLFLDKYPSAKILALAFLFLIGFLLLTEGFDKHIPRSYVYFAMLFSISIEFLNIRSGRRKAKIT